MSEADMVWTSFKIAMSNPVSIKRREALESEKINPKSPLWDNSPLRFSSTQRKKLLSIQQK